MTQNSDNPGTGRPISRRRTAPTGTQPAGRPTTARRTTSAATAPAPKAAIEPSAPKKTLSAAQQRLAQLKERGKRAIQATQNAHEAGREALRQKLGLLKGQRDTADMDRADLERELNDLRAKQRETSQALGVDGNDLQQDSEGVQREIIEKIRTLHHDNSELEAKKAELEHDLTDALDTCESLVAETELLEQKLAAAQAEDQQPMEAFEPKKVE